VFVLLTGCGTPPTVQRPPQARLSDAYARGNARVQTGDFSGAATAYEEARRLARSIEDADAIAAADIDLSIVYRRLGRDAAARDALAEILDGRRQAYPERRLMQAELRRAILLLAGGDASGAADWAGRAERRCAACDLAPAILNVRAQAAL